MWWWWVRVTITPQLEKINAQHQNFKTAELHSK